MEELGEPQFRANQIFSWIHKKNVCEFDRMSNLPRNLVSKLEKRFILNPLKDVGSQKSKDGTTKFLLELEDGHTIETVLIPSGKRFTLCLSSQLGCKIRCPFCVSGSHGFLRNLKTSEIAGQVLAARRAGYYSITNIVYMGIGEPLDNFDNVIESVRLINSREGINIGARHITISTCGIVPGIRRLKNTGLQTGLSVSLHATSDELRNRLVPVNRKYPLKELLKACSDYRQSSGRTVTLEYALMSGINDSVEEARELARITKKINAKINLIPCNPNRSSEYQGAGKDILSAFKKTIESAGARITLRNTKGRAILAACGQLAFDRKEAGPTTPASG